MIPIRYTLRSLYLRRKTTIATVFGLALVVFVFAGAQMLAHGLRATLGRGAREDVALVLRAGADSELQSILDTPTAKQVIAEHGGTNPSLRPAAEIVMVGLLPRASSEGTSNVLVRGVTEASYAVRAELDVIEGRRPALGTNEVAVGQGLRGRFAGLALGERFELRRGHEVKVVGILSENGAPADSEVWADVETVRSAFSREGLYSVVRLPVSPDKLGAVREEIQRDRRTALQLLSAAAYAESQGDGAGTFVAGV